MILQTHPPYRDQKNVAKQKVGLAGRFQGLRPDLSSFRSFSISRATSAATSLSLIFEALLYSLRSARQELHVFRERQQFLSHPLQPMAVMLLFLGERCEPRDEVPDPRANCSGSRQ
jgi:hypothetical protein